MNPNRREILVRKRIFIENNIRNVNQICPTRVNPCSNNNRPLKFNRVRVTPTHFDPFGSFGTATICRKIYRDSTKATRIDPSGARFRRATIAVELQKPRNYENGYQIPSYSKSYRGVRRPIIMIAFGAKEQNANSLRIAESRERMSSFGVHVLNCDVLHKFALNALRVSYPHSYLDISISGTDPPPGSHDALFLLARYVRT